MIRIENIELIFGKKKIFDCFSLHLNQGQRTVLTGESGGGKTSLLNILAGFVLPNSGIVTVGGHRLSPKSILAIRQLLSYLPQNVNLDFPQGRDLLLHPFSFRHNQPLLPSSTEIANLLSRLLLDPEILNQPLNSLSGGEKQRLLLGAILFLKRPILLLDEPTTALDDLSVRAVRNLLSEQHKTTILSVSHDQRWIESADTIIPIDAYQNFRID